MNTFTAANVARDLRAQGIVVLKFSEGNDVEDSDVTLSARLSVQICSLTGSRLNLVLETESGLFKFFPVRRTLAALVADINKLAKENPDVLAAPQVQSGEAAVLKS